MEHAAAEGLSRQQLAEQGQEQVVQLMRSGKQLLDSYSQLQPTTDAQQQLQALQQQYLKAAADIQATLQQCQELQQREEAAAEAGKGFGTGPPWCSSVPSSACTMQGMGLGQGVAGIAVRLMPAGRQPCCVRSYHCQSLLSPLHSLNISNALASEGSTSTLQQLQRLIANIMS
jgi:multidrug efflux pump subunit AcrA (membrane-fusion protein)